MSDSDLDSLYKSASGQEAARPSAAVRQAILEHARRLAHQTGQQPAGAASDPPHARERARNRAAEPSRWPGWTRRWSQLRWQVAVPLAAAAIAVIVLQPQLRSTLPASAQLQQSAAPPTAAQRPPPLPPAPDTVMNSPLPLTAQRRPAPVPFPAASQSMPRESSGAPAAPPATPSATPPAAAARAAPAPAEAAPTANALAANLASSADLASSPSTASASRRQARPSAAPLAELREQAEMPGEAAGAHVLSQSELLHQAAAQGDEQRVRSLLQQNAMLIDARDASGRTALMLAVLQGHEAIVRALLQQGADPNIGDAAGRTPIAVARQQHQPRMVEALLQAGAH